MSLPTKGEVYEQLTEHLRRAQEASATLAHLNNAEGDAPGTVIGRGWLHVSEALRKMQHMVIMLSTKGRLQ